MCWGNTGSAVVGLVPNTGGRAELNIVFLKTQLWWPHIYPVLHWYLENILTKSEMKRKRYSDSVLKQKYLRLDYKHLVSVHFHHRFSPSTCVWLCLVCSVLNEGMRQWSISEISSPPFNDAHLSQSHLTLSPWRPCGRLMPDLPWKASSIFHLQPVASVCDPWAELLPDCFNNLQTFLSVSVSAAGAVWGVLRLKVAM